MIINISINQLIFLSVLSGIAGTIGFTLFMQGVSKSGLAKADMVNALGSLFTKSIKNAFKVGLLIHFGSGIFFGFFYTFAITAFDVHGLLSSVGAGILISFIHGGVVGFLLVATVAEHHPIPQFQKAGFSVDL